MRACRALITTCGTNSRRWHGLTQALITKKESRYMDVNLDRGAGYGDTLTWTDLDRPKRDLQPVEVQVDLDTDKFYKLFVDLLTGPTPQPGKGSTP